ncbi:MAG: cytochrome c [Saprospiraceae bacterium]
MKYIIAFSVLGCLALLQACSPSEGNRRGHEFMPDMVHPTGYEANLYDYYFYNRWGTEEEYKKYTMPRYSVPGTVARGEISVANAADANARMMAMESFDGMEEGSMAIAPNGSVPYYYADTEPERSRAMREITKNPFPITDAGLEQGKNLYSIYCGVCHGEKGDGQGFLVRDGDPAKGITAGVYPAAPANLVLDTFVYATSGRIYHAIMHCKNVMGPYADKLSYRERWEVIHYIRSLQAQSKKLLYSSASNTFNTEATPWKLMESSIKKKMHPDSTAHLGIMTPTDHTGKGVTTEKQ